MAYSSSAVHSHQRRSAAENGRLVFSLLWLASEILVERNNSSTVWPIHRMIRYKIKQKSLLNSKLWSGPLCCQNNNINWEQGQSRWERGLVRAAKEQEDLQRHLNLWDRRGGAFFFFFFLVRIFVPGYNLNSKERARTRARLTELQWVRLLGFSSPRRFSEPIENPFRSWSSWRAHITLHCSHLPSLWCGS